MKKAWNSSLDNNTYKMLLLHIIILSIVGELHAITHTWVFYTIQYVWGEINLLAQEALSFLTLCVSQINKSKIYIQTFCLFFPWIHPSFLIFLLFYDFVLFKVVSRLVYRYTWSGFVFIYQIEKFFSYTYIICLCLSKDLLFIYFLYRFSIDTCYNNINANMIVEMCFFIMISH